MSLKVKWKVSIAALIMRAAKLGVITESKKRRCFTTLSAAGYRTVEPVPLPKEEPAILDKLLEIYQKDFGYTVRELCKMLCISQGDFRLRYLGLPPLRIREL